MSKKISIRTCVACRQSDARSQLMRVVRTPQNTVVVDPLEKMPGRGAYICFNESCINKALTEKRLDRALRISLSEPALENLAVHLHEVFEKR